MLRSEDAMVATDALLYFCFNIDDPKWIQVKCVQVIEVHRSEHVRGLVLTCIGHVARMRKVIEKALVLPFCLEVLNTRLCLTEPKMLLMISTSLSSDNNI